MRGQYKVQKGFIVDHVEGKQVIFDNKKSVLHSLNETGSYIFSQLEKGVGSERIAQLFAKRYALPLQQATRDVESFIRELAKKKIIRMT